MGSTSERAQVTGYDYSHGLDIASASRFQHRSGHSPLNANPPEAEDARRVEVQARLKLRVGSPIHCRLKSRRLPMQRFKWIAVAAPIMHGPK